MNLKLSHKFFIVNLGIIVCLTSIFLGLSYISSKTLLSKAMNGVDVRAMEGLATTLSRHYEQQQSWQAYTENKDLWNDTVNSIFFEVFMSLSAPPTAEQIGAITAANSDTIPQKQKTKPVCDPPFGSFLQRLALLDKNKRELVRPEIVKTDVNFQEIELNGKTIGWLKVGKINVDTLPLGSQIFSHQLKLTSLAALCGAVIATIVSYLLSRHITSPIIQLTSCAQKIAKRDFESTIEINTKDELHDLGQSFNAISKELNLYDTRQKQWLMDISHELRTPLTILIGEISAICDNITHCDTKAVISLQDEVMQIKRLTDDLNDIATLERMDFSLHKQQIEPLQLLEHCIQRYQNELTERSINLNTSLTSVPMIMIGDSDRLAQVFRNLLENCIRYTNSPGELWIEGAKEGKHLLISLEDSGPGIPTNALGKIFDRLYRIDASRNRASGGSGLGLSICKQIVLAHNGDINASHSSKGGLCISITLPLTNEEWQ